MERSKVDEVARARARERRMAAIDNRAADWAVGEVRAHERRLDRGDKRRVSKVEMLFDNPDKCVRQGEHLIFPWS